MRLLTPLHFGRSPSLGWQHSISCNAHGSGILHELSFKYLLMKFFCIYRVPVDVAEKWRKETSEEERKKQDAEIGEKMMAWLKKYDEEIVDKGLPLGKNTRLTIEGAAPVTNDLNYYCTIETESIDAAIAIVKDGLILVDGAFIDIMEVPEGKM